MKRTGFRRPPPRPTSEQRLSASLRARAWANGLEEAPAIDTRPKGHYRWLPRDLWYEGSPYVLSEHDWDGTVQDWAIEGGFRVTWHDNNSASHRNDPGWFDRIFFKQGRALFVELKVRWLRGDANTLSTAQKKYASWAALAGLEVYHWLWPDDAPEAWETLTGQPWSACDYAKEMELYAHG